MTDPGGLAGEILQRLNAQVDRDGLGIAEVVRRWRLQQAGVVGAD